MRESERSIVAQIQDYRKGLEDLPHLEDSFVIFQAVIEPMLKEIAETSPDLKGLPRNRKIVISQGPQYSEIEDEIKLGYIALIWGSGEPISRKIDKKKVEKFEAIYKKVTTGNSIRRKKMEKDALLLAKYGNRTVSMSGFNIVLATAEIDIRGDAFVPVVNLHTNYGEVLYESTLKELNSGVSELVPHLSDALDVTGSKYGRWTIYPTVRTYAMQGYENIFPEAPFL